MRYNFFSNSFCPILNITNIGYAHDASVTRFGPGARNSYIIHYVISGKGYFNGRKVLKGQGFLITPNMQEQYFPDSVDPWEFLWVISDDPKILKIFDIYNADQQSNIFNYDYVDKIKETAEYLLKNNQTKHDSFEMLEIFLSFFKYQQKNFLLNYNKSTADIYLEAAANYIELNIQNPVTVYELTRFLGISQPYLFKIFKKRYAISPKQYILNQKIERAKILLTETNLSVKNIANSIGFEDALSFSKAFKQKTGLSPQNHRNTYNKKT